VKSRLVEAVVLALTDHREPLSFSMRREPGMIPFMLKLSLLFLICFSCQQVISSEQQSLIPGATLVVGERKVRIDKLDSIPVAQSEYSKRFQFDSADNPKLQELREAYRLDEIVASGKEEFEKQLLLMNWVHTRFKKFGQPSTSARGALDILKGIANEETFFCSQYAQLMVSSAASLGWICRELALRRHQGAGMNGTTEHATTEIWSNQHRKWIMLDPTVNLYLEKDGVPLNAYEIRQEWFYNNGKALVFVQGKDGRRLRKSDLPLVITHYPGFGDLTLDPDELDKYGFIGYIPNTNLMDAREDYGQMFIVQDDLCVGTSWHKRSVPKNPAVDPYFPLGQTELDLWTDGKGVIVRLATMTPNFQSYEIKIDNGRWQPSGSEFQWNLRPGVNRLQARTINAFGVHGPISSIEVSLN
jgi:hypothetical protein